ncbi:MAG: flagellar biosynthesis protein FliQ [Rickettsiales bacterium]
MGTNEVLEVIRDGIYVLIIISAPIMITALIVGLIIALMQALTQIQEATLTFVPKVLAMLLVLVLTLPFMVEQLTSYNHRLYERIANIE